MLTKTTLLATALLMAATAFSKPTRVRKSGGTKNDDGSITYRTVDSFNGLFKKTLACTGEGIQECVFSSAIAHNGIGDGIVTSVPILDITVGAGAGAGSDQNPLVNTTGVEQLVMRFIDQGKSAGKGLYGNYYYTYTQGSKNTQGIFSYDITIDDKPLW